MNIDLNDDISDLLGGPVVERALPTGEIFERIRATVPEHVETCPSCRGSGKFRSYAGRIVGDCFKCKGAGKRSFKTSSDQRAKAADRRAAVPVNRWEDFVAQYPAEAAVLVKGIAQTYGDGRWNATCADIKGKVEKYGDLHEGTLAMLSRAVVRDAERAAQRAQTQTAPVVDIDLSKITTAFANAAKTGKRLILRFDGITLKIAPAAGKNAGSIYVTSTLRTQRDYQTGEDKQAYLGKISADGRFEPTRQYLDSDRALLAEAAADPLAAAVKYGRLTNSCSCCGLGLTNEISVQLGIGPICRGKWGF